MAFNPLISAPESGMNTDISTFNSSGKIYPYALNSEIEDFSGNEFHLQNAASNILAVNFPQGFKVIGKKEIHEQDRIIFMLVNPTTHASEVGEVQSCEYNDNTDDKYGSYGCDDCLYPEQVIDNGLETKTQTPYCSYRTIISSNCLKFNIDYPIDIEYRITDCGLNIYFTDGFNERRFMYFKYEDENPRGKLILDERFKVVTGFTDGDCKQPIYSQDLDCNKILYHPAHSIPCISEMEVISGGSLKAGTYQAFVCYADVTGTPISQYFPASQPIPVFTKYLTFETNYQTDKAISIKIDGLDTNSVFSYFNLVIAETIDNFTEFKLAETLPLGRTSFIYTGDNPSSIKLSSEEIFFKRPFYATAASVTKSNNYLFFSNVKEFAKTNLQRVANNIKLQWETVAIPEAVYANPENTWRYRSNLRDEVYPYGIVFQYRNGEETCAYHIPGRTSSPSDLEYVNNNDVLEDTSCNNINRNRRWQVYNTGSLVGTPHQVTENCKDEKCWEYGEMAYWESIEKYPNDPLIWGDLCGKPIRHHKFPDCCITHIHDGLNEERTFTQTNMVYPIGVKVNHESVKLNLNEAVVQGWLSQEEKDKIIGYRIVRGNRVGNKSIAAKGLIFDMWSYDKNNQKYYYANYPYNDLRPDSFISNTKNTYNGSNTSNPVPNEFTKTNRYTFHSPDVHFVNATIGTEISLETEEYGQSEGYFNYCEDEARYKLLTTYASLSIFAGGFAAALSSLNEKECISYTTKTSSLTESTATGTTPVGIVTGSSPGATATIVVPSPFAAAGTATTQYNQIPGVNPFGVENPFLPFQKTNNLPNPLKARQVSEVTRNTCKGTTFQILNPASLLSTTNIFDAFVYGLSILAGGWANQAIYFLIIGMKEMEILRELVKAVLPLRKFAIQYNSAGIYNNYKCVAKTGNKNRKIVKHAYLLPQMQMVDETVSGNSSSIFINNWHRESSVFLKLDDSKPLPNTSIQDTSRGSMDDFFGNNNQTFDKLNERVYRTISSYYASIKTFVPDQYGDIYNIDYLETNGCLFDLTKEYNECKHVFGGDTFITRFALKRKMPFFLQSRFQLEDEDYVKYSELGNVGFPNYYFNSHETILEKMEDEGILRALTSLRDLVSAPRTRLDAKVTTALFEQKGYIHLYNYGIPYFLVESDINTDFRYAEDSKAKDFYPHQRNLDYWLQEKNVPISEDNYYFYNKTYSKQNHESVICVNQATVDTRECKTSHPNRIIYYDETNSKQISDNWIVSKANNFYDFPLSLGKLISADGIENEKVLVRFENGIQIFNAYDTLKTGSGSDIQVGTGGVFQSRPQEFSSTDLGYAGTQHTAILNNEFGHIVVDAKRGQVFNILPDAKGIDDLSKDGMKNWFKENLPFQLLKSFPTLQHFDIDNMYKGIGIDLAFDKRFNRFFLTKKDYKPIKAGIQYDALNKTFFVRNEENVRTDIDLSNKAYFCDKSWTLSYNFITKSWVSFHSFIPNYYVQHIDYFESGINGSHSSLWSHNLTNKSFQVYYGKLYPFIIETISDRVIGQNILQYVDFNMEAIRYHNEFDFAVNRGITFNKAIVYNSRQNTGELELIPKDNEDLSQFGKYPEITDKGIKINVSNSNGVWRFNDFWDNIASQTNNIPIWLRDCDNITKRLNPKAFNYFQGSYMASSLRNEQCFVRLINDKYSQYKFIFKYTINNENIIK